MDFVMYGGPFERVAQCVESSWGTGDLGAEPPKFGDLSAFEEDLKLFIGVGLFKRLKRNQTKL